MGEIQKVAFCPHCGNRAPQELILTHYFDEEVFDTDGKLLFIPSVYFITKCMTCNQILLYNEWGDISDKTSFTDTKLVWPDPGVLDKSVPDRIRTYYQEATRIKNLAPNAFAVQIRRALEAICEDRNAKRDSLQKMLLELASRGEVPPLLAEMTDVIRLLGNIGAHAADQDVRADHVHLINDFFRAIVEYVYVGRAKIKTIRDELERLKKTQK